MGSGPSRKDKIDQKKTQIEEAVAAAKAQSDTVQATIDSLTQSHNTLVLSIQAEIEAMGDLSSKDEATARQQKLEELTIVQKQVVDQLKPSEDNVTRYTEQLGKVQTQLTNKQDTYDSDRKAQQAKIDDAKNLLQSANDKLIADKRNIEVQLVDYLNANNVTDEATISLIDLLKQLLTLSKDLDSQAISAEQLQEQVNALVNQLTFELRLMQTAVSKTDGTSFMNAVQLNAWLKVQGFPGSKADILEQSGVNGLTLATLSDSELQAISNDPELNLGLSKYSFSEKVHTIQSNSRTIVTTLDVSSDFVEEIVAPINSYQDGVNQEMQRLSGPILLFAGPFAQQKREPILVKLPNTNISIESPQAQASGSSDPL